MADGPPIRPVGGVGTKFPKILLYGISGAGKTRMVGSCGKGTLILRPPTDHTDSIFDTECVEWVIRDWTEMLEAQEYLRTEGHKHKWVWLDSISLFQEIGLDDIWDKVKTQKPHRAEFGIDRGEYKINMERLSEWVRHVVGLDAFNFGITALPFEGENIDGELQLMPWVQGKNMSSKVCGYMNTVAYLEVTGQGRKVKRVLHTEADERFYAKDQFNALASTGGKLESPTMPKLMAAIEAARGSRPTAARRPTRRTRSK